MARLTRQKGPKETLVTDQPGRKILFFGILLSIIFGYFLKALTNPNFVQTELSSAVGRIHPSTQISWGQAYISLRDGWLPRFSVIMSDVKIVASETCWGEPLLYSREVELPFSFIGFFEKGEPLRRLIVRDAFLEFRSQFQCKKPEPGTTVAAGTAAPAPVSSGPVRLKSTSETKSRPDVILRDFVFENLKIRQPNWVYPDWQFQLLHLRIMENSPWHARLDAEFFIPETEGVDTGAKLKMVYKEFPTQFLDVDIRGHWREGNFRAQGQWSGPQVGWSFNTSFSHFPFQFLKTVALRTKTPWNWPEKPMWFSFKSETVKPFIHWNDSQHAVKGLQIEGDLGELKIPDLDIQSWQPFRVKPFVFVVNNADLSTAFESQKVQSNFINKWGFISGQGQWIREDEFRFQGLLQNLEFNLAHQDQRITQAMQQAKMSANLTKGDWKISLEEFEFANSAGAGTIAVQVEGPQNMKEGKLTGIADKWSPPVPISQLYGILSTDSRWDWKLNMNWRNFELQEASSTLSTPLFESRELLFEKPALSMKMRPNQAMDFQLGATIATIREPLDYFPEELKNQNFPLRLGRFQFNWSENRDGSGRWQIQSPRLATKGEVDDKAGIKGTLSVPGSGLYTVQGTKTDPQIIKR